MNDYHLNSCLWVCLPCMCLWDLHFLIKNPAITSTWYHFFIIFWLFWVTLIFTLKWKNRCFKQKNVFHPSLSLNSQRIGTIEPKNPYITKDVFTLRHLLYVESSEREKNGMDSRDFRVSLSRTLSLSLSLYLFNKSHLSRVTLICMYPHSALHRDGIISMAPMWK